MNILSRIPDQMYINKYCSDEEQIVDYERTYEENELLGLNDMKTEDY